MRSVILLRIKMIWIFFVFIEFLILWKLFCILMKIKLFVFVGGFVIIRLNRMRYLNIKDNKVNYYFKLRFNFKRKKILKI